MNAILPNLNMGGMYDPSAINVDPFGLNLNLNLEQMISEHIPPFNIMSTPTIPHESQMGMIQHECVFINPPEEPC